jgi:hypothetical protein
MIQTNKIYEHKNLQWFKDNIRHSVICQEVNKLGKYSEVYSIYISTEEVAIRFFQQQTDEQKKFYNSYREYYQFNFE